MTTNPVTAELQKLSFLSIKHFDQTESDVFQTPGCKKKRKDGLGTAELFSLLWYLLRVPSSFGCIHYMNAAAMIYVDRARLSHWKFSSTSFFWFDHFVNVRQEYLKWWNCLARKGTTPMDQYFFQCFELSNSFSQKQTEELVPVFTTKMHTDWLFPAPVPCIIISLLCPAAPLYLLFCYNLIKRNVPKYFRVQFPVSSWPISFWELYALLKSLLHVMY